MKSRQPPIPAQGQVLTVSRSIPGGWISAWFWPAGSGFHFVYQACGDAGFIADASDAPLSSDWIQTIRRFQMLGVTRSKAAIVPTNDDMLQQLEGWRLETLDAKPPPRLVMADG